MLGFGSRPSPAIAWLNAAGYRDTSFDFDGRVTLDFGGDSAVIYRVGQLADGNHILVVGGGSTTTNSNPWFALARLNSDGSLDAGFGSGGKVLYEFDLGGSAVAGVATDFVELPDGKLMVCGAVYVGVSVNADYGCMRFLADGTPDPTFPEVVIPIDLGGDFLDVSTSLQRDARGRFVLAGAARRATDNTDFAVVRLSADGALDTSFGNYGVRVIDSLPASGGTDPERNNVTSAMLLQPDGTILIAGGAEPADIVDPQDSGEPQFELVRLIGDTIFDDDFGY